MNSIGKLISPLNSDEDRLWDCCNLNIEWSINVKIMPIL